MRNIPVKPGQKIWKSLRQQRYTDGKLAREKMFSIFSHRRNTNQNPDERSRAHPLQRLQNHIKRWRGYRATPGLRSYWWGCNGCGSFGKQLNRPSERSIHHGLPTIYLIARFLTKRDENIHLRRKARLCWLWEDRVLWNCRCAGFRQRCATYL